MSDKQVESLQLKINNLENVLSHVGAYVFTKDLQGRYTYVNQKVLDAFGRRYEDVIGKDDSQFFDMELSDQLYQNDQKVMRENITVENEEFNVIKASGEHRIYHTVKNPLHDDQGKVIGLCGISSDITEQKKLQDVNKEQQQLLDTVLNNVGAYIYMKDTERRFRYVNKHVTELFGLPVSQIIGCLDTDVLPQEVADHFWDSDKKVFESNASQETEEEFADKDGNMRHYLSVKIPYQFSRDSKVLIGFSTDVTELYALKERYQQQANTDALTGLFNRRYFFENADREFKRTQRHSLSLAAISIDIDNFKQINDKYGHPIGDQVLLAVVKNIIPNVRLEDVLARIGGEEFSVLLPETTPDKAQLVAERIRAYQDANEFVAENGIHIAVKLSVGVSALRAADESFLDLYSRSDKALYQAKYQGKNTVYYLP
ncbi:diguanylate cyclase [Dasania marina]|uniref:sensor domain-containing diguanylate cyclase n=1 Tax=Dasania marina TaxID=471499 RepID=UPI0030D7CE93